MKPNENISVMPLKILIVDDEDLARKKIVHFLGDDADCIIVGSCENGFNAVEAVCAEVPDVIFLDIQMPELDGFETLRMIRDSLDEDVQMPLVVFITAFDHFALRAFDEHAVDYLLKPFDFERFQTMLNRVKIQLQNRNARTAYETLRREMQKKQDSPRYTERFAFKTRGKIYFIRTDEVEWIEADRNYALFHVGDMKHVLRSTFGDLEEMLDPSLFLRVHRSTIVRKSTIKELTKRSERGYQVVLESGVELDIGSLYREAVFAAMGLVAPQIED